jgi:hypothetical protein
MGVYLIYMQCEVKLIVQNELEIELFVHWNYLSIGIICTLELFVN